MKRSLWKELCNKLNFISKTNCKSFEVTPIIRTAYITKKSETAHLCLSPFCLWLVSYHWVMGNWRNSPVSISTTARLNRRILCPFLNMEGLFKSRTQNNKLNRKEAAAITPNKTWRTMSTLLLGGDGGFEIPVVGRIVMLFMAANWSEFYENFP